MQDINEIFSEIGLVEQLSNYEIVLEVINGTKQYAVFVYNFDGSKSKANITVDELMYLTEYGSLSSPSFHIFDYIIKQILRDFEPVINKIIEGIFKDDFSENQIDAELNKFELSVNLKIPTYFHLYTDDISFLAKALQLPGTGEYLLDPSILAKYVRCKIHKKL